MQYTVRKENSYTVSQWMGGHTKELAIYPNDSKYVDRNFLWRLSSATIEDEESTFSNLPDYDRVIMVLDGEVVLSYENERVVRLKELDQDRFDGAWKTKSFGKITDYNLMVRKGSEGYMDVIELSEKAESYDYIVPSDKPFKTCAIYLKEGYLIANVNKESIRLNPGELLVMEGERDEKLKYKLMGEGVVIRSEIYYGETEGELGPEIIPEEKATFDDFKKSVFIANTQFRGAKFLFKSLKTKWYDEALYKGIRKIERIYITYLIFLVGLMAITLPVFSAGDDKLGLWLILVWFIFDSLVISPLIYMAILPKPISKHIKNINELTPYEKKVEEERLATNERVERIAKKYKNSGRNMPK